MLKKNKIIFALSTPPGKGAISVIRLSGPNSYDLIKNISTNMPKKSNFATLNKIINNKTKDVIDQTITTFFKSPKNIIPTKKSRTKLKYTNALSKFGHSLGGSVCVFS